MIKSKLFRFLNVLKKEEWEHLKKMVYADFFNENEEVRLFFCYLYTHFEKKKTAYFEKETVFQYLYPNKPYKDGKMRKLMAELMKVVKQLIHYHPDIYYPQEKYKYFLFCETRHLHKEVKDGLKELQFEQAKSPYQNRMYFQTQLLWEEFHLRWMYATQHPQRGLGLENLITQSHISMIAAQLEWHCALLSNKNLYKVSESTFFLKYIYPYIQSDKTLWEVPFIRMYFYIINILMENSNEEIENEAFNYYKEIADILSLLDKKSFAAHFRNIYERKLSQGHFKYHIKLRELHLLQIKHGLIFTSANKMTNTIFYLVFLNALQLKEWEWAEKWLAEYLPYVSVKDEQEKHNIHQLCKANLSFEQMDYVKTLHIIHEITKFSSDMQEINLRILRLKTYYMLEVGETLLDAIKSNKAFIQRNSFFSKTFKKGVEFFLKYVGKLTENKVSNDTIQEVRRNSNVQEKHWLIEQMEKRIVQ